MGAHFSNLGAHFSASQEAAIRRIRHRLKPHPHLCRAPLPALQKQSLARGSSEKNTPKHYKPTHIFIAITLAMKAPEMDFMEKQVTVPTM